MIWARTAQIIDDAGPDAVVVHDMPLLVEKGMGAEIHLVVVVGASEDVRVRRLVDQRGMAEDDARARMAAQADDDARRAAADVWLENEATTEALRAQVLRLWTERIEPFELNLRHGILSARACRTRRCRRPDRTCRRRPSACSRGSATPSVTLPSPSTTSARRPCRGW